jgi:hypothetical protein
VNDGNAGSLRNEALVLALKRRLDATSAPSVRSQLQERIGQGERRFQWTQPERTIGVGSYLEAEFSNRGRRGCAVCVELG